LTTCNRQNPLKTGFLAAQIEKWPHGLIFARTEREFDF
jgi:hypothetical protein